jgi:hypothetical protein
MLTGMFILANISLYIAYILNELYYYNSREYTLNYATRNEQKVDQDSWLNQIYLNKNWAERYVHHAFIGYVTFFVSLIFSVISIIADGFFDHFEVSIYLFILYLLFYFVSDSYLIQYSYVNRIDPD